MEKPVKHYSIAAIAVLVILAAGASAFVYSGAYNMGVDDPRTSPISAAMQTLRNRSIQAHALSIVVPNLDDQQLILEGPANTRRCTRSAILRHA